MTESRSPADAAVALSRRDELFNDARVWAAFYRDGKNLGEVAEMFGARSIYDLNPWLSAPMTNAFLHAVNRQGWIDIDRAAPPEDDTPCDVWHEGERKTDFIWSAERQRWEKDVGYPTRTIVLLGRVSHWRPVPGAPGRG